MILLIAFWLFMPLLIGNTTFWRTPFYRVYEVNKLGQGSFFNNVCLVKSLNQVPGVNVNFSRRAQVFEHHDLRLVFRVVHLQ